MMDRGRHPRPEPDRRKRFLAGMVSAGVHLGITAALLRIVPVPAPSPVEVPATAMVMVQTRPEPPGAPGTADMQDEAPPSAAPPPVPPVDAPTITIERAAVAKATDNSDLLSTAQIAGASRAGEGGAGGGGCDMAQAVQRVLRRDPRVREAVAGAGRLGKASMLWDGDWVRSGGQEGKGLAVVRQAVIWEVGFAPEACRNEPMHGMVLLSLADGNTRFAIGARDWRWSDLLGLRMAR